MITTNQMILTMIRGNLILGGDAFNPIKMKVQCDVISLLETMGWSVTPYNFYSTMAHKSKTIISAINNNTELIRGLDLTKKSGYEKMIHERYKLTPQYEHDIKKYIEYRTQYLNRINKIKFNLT